MLSSVDSGCHTCFFYSLQWRQTGHVNQGSSLSSSKCEFRASRNGLALLGGSAEFVKFYQRSARVKIDPLFGSPSPLSVSKFGGSSPTAQERGIHGLLIRAVQHPPPLFTRTSVPPFQLLPCSGGKRRILHQLLLYFWLLF